MSKRLKPSGAQGRKRRKDEEEKREKDRGVAEDQTTAKRGSQQSNGSKCKCLNGYIGKVNPKLIKSGPVIHDPSIFCPQTEIIITTTADKKKCVNPESPFGKLILEIKNKHEKNGAVSTTTAASLTGLHTTSRLRLSTTAPKRIDLKHCC